MKNYISRRAGFASHSSPSDARPSESRTGGKKIIDRIISLPPIWKTGILNSKKLLFLLAFPLLAAGCAGQQSASIKNTSTPDPKLENSAQKQAQGRAVFYITDAGADLQNISSVKLVVDKLEIHSGTQGWTNIAIQPKTFDLLQLKQSGIAQILADVQINAGVYDQLRLNVSKVTVVKAGVETEAKLPSSQLKITGRIVVKNNAAASVLLDFLLEKSLHLTGNGTFILTPVIKLESKSDAQVRVKEDGRVDEQNGKEEENITVGSDENGEIKTNFQLNDKTKLELTTSGAIHLIDDSKSENGIKVSADQALLTAKNKGSITEATSVRLETQEGKKVWHITGLRALIVVNVYVDANTGTIVTAQ